MIILARDTGAVVLDVGREALCVRHESCTAPRTGDGCTHMTWGEFVQAPATALAGRTTMVVVGLSRIINPANRTRVGPLLLRPRVGLRRISVDRTIFVCDPWRSWFHFGCVGVPYREYTYSYLAESHWKMAQEGLRDDPFAFDALAACGDGVVRSEDAGFFDALSVDRVGLSAAVHAEYARIKAAAFVEEHTSSAIVSRLAAFAAVACPQRRIPTPARLFAASAHRIVQTDLRVDDYLVGALRARVDLCNAVARRFHAG